METITTIGLDIAKSASGSTPPAGRSWMGFHVQCKSLRCSAKISSDTVRWVTSKLSQLMSNRQRTQLLNAIRAHMSEFGVVGPVGRMGLNAWMAVIADREDLRICLIRVCRLSWLL